MMELVTVVLIALATHRTTRFLTKDKLTEKPRIEVQWYFEQRWEARTGRTKDDTWGSKRAYLISCAWCTSIYVALVMTAVTASVTSVPVPVLTILAASTVTGMIDSMEDDE